RPVPPISVAQALSRLLARHARWPAALGAGRPFAAVTASRDPIGGGGAASPLAPLSAYLVPTLRRASDSRQMSRRHPRFLRFDDIEIEMLEQLVERVDFQLPRPWHRGAHERIGDQSA